MPDAELAELHIRVIALENLRLTDSEVEAIDGVEG
jgi:hypothetical protein